MAVISKATIATILGLSESEISDSVYTWGTKQFFMLTALKETETQKTFRKFISQPTSIIKLPDINIKTIDDIKIDGTSVDGLEEFVTYKYNPDSGFLWYGGGFGNSVHTLDGESYSSRCISGGSFGGGNLVAITYTLLAYTHTDLHDYLISLLVAKALSIFTPEKISQVRMVKIGKYQKQLGSSSANLNEYNRVLDMEIDHIIDLLNGDDGKLTSGPII